MKDGDNNMSKDTNIWIEKEKKERIVAVTLTLSAAT
jgi:hypothetical protein